VNFKTRFYLIIHQLKYKPSGILTEIYSLNGKLPELSLHVKDSFKESSDECSQPAASLYFLLSDGRKNNLLQKAEIGKVIVA
jgi:hypothetical protein